MAGRWGTAVGALVAAGLLLHAAPTPGRAWSVLARPSVADDPTAPLVAAVALAAWALAGWLLALATLTLGARSAGPAGALCGALLRRAAPAAVRRAVAVGLGVGLALTGPGTAHAEPVPPPAAAAAPGPALDWPVLQPPPQPAVPPAPGGAAQPAPQPAPAAPGSPGERRTVVVQPGDTLWGLAQDHLPAPATAAATARAWPAWWSVNRAVVGDDPDLLHPGQRLVVPDPTASPPS